MIIIDYAASLMYTHLNTSLKQLTSRPTRVLNDDPVPTSIKKSVNGTGSSHRELYYRLESKLLQC